MKVMTILENEAKSVNGCLHRKKLNTFSKWM